MTRLRMFRYDVLPIAVVFALGGAAALVSGLRDGREVIVMLAAGFWLLAVFVLSTGSVVVTGSVIRFGILWFRSHKYTSQTRVTFGEIGRTTVEVDGVVVIRVMGSLISSDEDLAALVHERIQDAIFR